MTTTCPHCSVHIDIDPQTHAALQGQTHFQCPGCNCLVAVPLMSAASPQPPSPAPATILAQAHRGLNRNLLILGSAALLVLGGLGFFLASRGGRISNSEQKITNEIIHNNYFQNLIASGTTSRTDLESMAFIRPYGTGFIGISKESLTWKQAQNLAERTGAEIPSTDQSEPSWLGPPDELEISFPSLAGNSIWLQERSDARVFDGGNVSAPHAGDASTTSRHKVLLHWRQDGSGGEPGGHGEWMVLFDGNDLSKWRGTKTTDFPDGAWAVENGALRNLHGTNDQSLVTRESFRDFELEFEWKFSPGGNSGIFYGMREFQLVDDVGNPNGQVPVTSCGALCYFIAPNESKMLQPVGEFNRGRLVVSGNHVEHWINGEKVVEYELGSPALKSLVAAGRFRNLPGYKEMDTEACETPVSLQSHGGTVWFRNIRIRSLNPASSVRSSANSPPTAELARKPAPPFSGSLPGTIWVVRDSLGDRYYFEFAPDGLLNYEGERGLRPNGKWRQDGSTVSIEINEGVANLTGTLSGRQIRGDAQSTTAGHWTWEAVPR